MTKSMGSAEHPTAPIAIISPVRDESKLIRGTLDAMVAQTIWPREWLLVDDGSTDDTAAIVSEYAERYPFIRLTQRQNRGKRVLGSGVIAAFNDGLAQLEHTDWQYICKLDGDMTFDPRYLETVLAKLEAEPDLAAASGKVYRPETSESTGDSNRTKLVEEYMIDEMVAGQFKFYKREPFEQMGGFAQTILWDGIDIHKSRMNGWRTESFYHDDARLYHHRLMGSSDKNVYKGRVRLGRGIWFMGYHPAYAFASAMFRMHEKPFIVGGLIIWGAYCYAALRGEPRYDDAEFRRSLQSWQLSKLRALPKRFWRKLAG